MIKKISSITNLGIYRGFEWDAEVRSQDGQILDLKQINILYGRNYSGKTTLSRIFRAMETGYLSEKYEMPSFEIELRNGQKLNQSNLQNHGLAIRVFNEDFVRMNLRFITDPDEDIEPFAILGEDNNRLEAEVRDLEAKLGASDEGAETGLHADSKLAAAESFFSGAPTRVLFDAPISGATLYRPIVV